MSFIPLQINCQFTPIFLSAWDSNLLLFGTYSPVECLLTIEDNNTTDIFLKGGVSLALVIG